MSKKSKEKKLIKIEATYKNSILDWIFFAGIILIVFLPLLNFPPLFSPPDFGKAIIFRTVVSILLFLFVVKSLFSKSFGRGWLAEKIKGEGMFYQRKSAEAASSKDEISNDPAAALRAKSEQIGANQRKPQQLVLISLAILFFIFLLATIFSQDWHHSLFDTPYRSGGSLNFLLYIIFAVLVFLTIGDEKKWQKIWIAAFIIGLLTCFIAIEQRFGLIGGKFIPHTGIQTPSTLGGPIFFGNYIMMLALMALCFEVSGKTKKERFFYIFSFLVFSFAVFFCAAKRGPSAGFLAGIAYFIFFFPFASPRKWLKLKLQTWIRILAVVICLLSVLGLNFLKTHPEISSSLLEKNETLFGPINTLSGMYPSISTLSSRASSWLVSLESIKEKLIIGWGPENFSVAFDKNYDPSLPGIEIDPRGWWGTHASWWDKPHNILIEYAVSAGILGLLAFLSLLGALFWQLQKIKKNPLILADNADRADAADNPRNPLKSAESANNSLLAHGVQATFLAYLVALFFSFDTPPTYIIFFLLMGFSLHLTKSGTAEISNMGRSNLPMEVRPPKIKWRSPLIIILFVTLIWFVWSLNIKPLQINKQINIAIAQSNAKNCQGATTIMENILKKHSFLDSYLLLKYIIVLDNCIEQQPENSLDFVKRAWEISKENTKIRPTYIRSWIFLGGYTNMLIEAHPTFASQNLGGQALQNLTLEELKKEANFAFQKAADLSPKRQETLIEWIKTDLLTGEYQKAKEKAQKCIDLNPQESSCYWLKDLTDIYLGKFKEIDEKYSPSYSTMGKDQLSQLAKVFGDVNYYPPLVEIYQNLISRYEGNNPQYYASLAFVYKELGEYDKAREQAEQILKLEPAAKGEVEKFLKELPAD